MNGVGIGDLGGADESGHIQVTAGGSGRADTDRFIGQAHMLEIAVSFGMYRNGLYTEFAAGALDT